MTVEIAASVLEELTDFEAARKGSYYTIIGAGGELAQWVNGYNELLDAEAIGTPAKWFKTTGKELNEYLDLKTSTGKPRKALDDGVTVLFFPLEGLHIGRLAMFKIRNEDRWFDDLVANARRS